MESTFVMFVGIVFFLKLAAGHASAPDLLKEKYSGPSILRPSMGPRKCGLILQVVLK